MSTEPGRYAVTDRGRRLADHVRAARAIGGEGRWIAARLSDGATDGTVYDSKADAVKHQLTETQCAYLVVPPAPMPEAEASAYLELHQKMYDAGYRLQDPDVTPIMTRDMMPALNRAGRRQAERDRKRAMRRHPSAMTPGGLIL
jgi:hypothetical protein